MSRVGTLGLCVHPSSGKEDGDILNAISALDTRKHHLGKISHLRKHSRVADSLSYRFIEKNSKFKFERLTTYTVRRTNLITSVEQHAKCSRRENRHPNLSR